MILPLHIVDKRDGVSDHEMVMEKATDHRFADMFHE